jgi:hypothetical protein
MIITVIPRIDEDGLPILFFPHEPANPGRMVCYVHLGQHGEADIGYYRQKTKPDRSNACADLIKEYASLPGGGRIVIRHRRERKPRAGDRPPPLLFSDPLRAPRRL